MKPPLAPVAKTVGVEKGELGGQVDRFRFGQCASPRPGMKDCRRDEATKVNLAQVSTPPG
jgi:hypothetical protein